MGKLSILIFMLIFGCIKSEFKTRDKVFSLAEFKTLVKQEDIEEYLLKNEYDFKQTLEEKQATILHILLEKKMQAEAIMLLDKLKELTEEERDEFLKHKDEKGNEALYLAIDRENIEVIDKMLELYSENERNERLCFEYYEETILDRAIKNKSAKVMMSLVELKKKYIPEDLEDSESYEVRTEVVITNILEEIKIIVEEQEKEESFESEEILLNEEEQKESMVLKLIEENMEKRQDKEEGISKENKFKRLIKEKREEILILASYIGDKGVIGRYIKEVEVNTKDKEGTTLLFLASHIGPKEVVELLLSKGASIDLTEKSIAATPLYEASGNGRKEIVELLLSKGAAIDLANKDGTTPLCIASWAGKKEVVELLLRKGAAIDLAEKNGTTPLYIASREGKKEVVELLLRKGAAIDLANEDGATPLYIASYNGHKEVAELLLSKGAAIDLANKDGTTPLYISSQNGHREIVELLLSKGADIDIAMNDGRMPLYTASCNGHKEVVELLLKKWAATDLTEKSIAATPLYIASQNGHREVVELLIEKRASIDLATNAGETPLYIASHNGHREVVELLIEKGAAIDLVTNEGETALYIASRKGHREVVKLLLTKGAAIDLGNKNGATPLYVASWKGHKEVVELLLEKGASIDLVDERGRTPLFVASHNGRTEVLKLLISKGADINKLNLKGESILEAALLSKKEEAIEELLSGCFAEGEGMILSSSKLIVNEGALNLFQGKIGKKPISWTLSFSKVYRVLNEIYSNQFIREIEKDLDKSSTTKLAEIMDEVTALIELNDKEVKITDIKNDDYKRFKYEIIDNLNKMFNKRRDLRVNAVYDKFINSREVILNRRVKAGYYKDYTILMLEILKSDLDKLLDRLKELIKEGSDVNAVNQSGNSCLMLAVRKDLKEVVEELINRGAEINAVNKSGENALMIAIEANFVDMVKRLAPLTNMNHEDIFKNTALMLAIKKIKLINPNVSDSEKRVKDIGEIIDILIKSGAKVTQEMIDLLNVGHKEVLELLLSNRRDL